MKKCKTNKISLFVILLLFFGGIQTSEAQFLKKLKKRVKDAAEETVLRKTEEKVTKKTEQTFDTIIDGKIVKRKRKVKKKPTNKPGSNNTTNSSKNEEDRVSTEEIKSWTKYNFVPGDEIIFEDDLVNEESGEFPSRWDLLKGNAENASITNENVINMLNGAKITPLMDKETYLPEVFTIEFDALFKSVHGPTYQDYRVNLWPSNKNYGYSEDKKYYCKSINVNVHGASMDCVDNSSNKEYASFDEAMIVPIGKPVWRHIAISFNKRSFKVFIDESRALSIPNVKFKPEAFSVEVFAYYNELSAIKNIRIAKGGKKLYDQLVADGKFVTRGILFDVNKASIKPTSYGVINKVAKMMQEHSDLKFSIEGHTDSDGEESYNQQLSLQRAEAVKKALINAGIDQERLETKGFGESVPLTENTTPEAKANNRRVEFVKL
ncbi:OmpA family protein [Aureibaculum luteum]|uniref:OmpA family protein n=1 Tax=Aureibaculum luteum TaxID=1548456 RepID=UPI001300B2CD|nr:OmpA family protein [Aureibaculum luteum]